MNVAVLAHSFPRFPGDSSGPFVRRLSEELTVLGHRVWVLVPFDPELRPRPGDPLRVESFRYVRPDGWHRLGYSRTLRRDRRLKLGGYLLSPLYLHFATRALVRLIRRQAIEMVHAHWILPNGYVAARAAAATGVPYAVTLHGSDLFMAERNALFRALARRALAGAAHVTSCSGELAERLLRLGGEEHRPRVHLVPNGTDVAAPGAGAAPPLPEGLREGGGPLVVAVGRLVDKKGFRHLLEAVPEIRRRVPGARLVLGGGGELRGALEERARRLGVLDAVSFTGALSHPEALGLIAAADLFVMPSVRDAAGNVDGLPVVVLEAMAAGRPVVASDVAGLPLAVDDGETGLLVPERDPAALAAAVGSLLADPVRARRLGEAGRRRVERELNWAAVAAVHDRLYRLVVGEEGE